MKKADSQSGYQHLLFIRYIIYVYNIPQYLYIVKYFLQKNKKTKAPQAISKRCLY